MILCGSPSVGEGGHPIAEWVPSVLASTHTRRQDGEPFFGAIAGSGPAYRSLAVSKPAITSSNSEVI